MLRVLAYTIHKDLERGGPNEELHMTLDTLGGDRKKVVDFLIETDLEARPVKKELLERMNRGEGNILALGHLHHLFDSLTELKQVYYEIMRPHGIHLVSWGAGLDTRNPRGVGSERTLEEFLALAKLVKPRD